MEGRNPRDRTLLTISVLETMLNRDVVRPRAILVVHVRSWFAAREAKLADSIIDELATDPDAPVEHVGREQASLWLTSRETA
jgi:hypothetical protein